MVVATSENPTSARRSSTRLQQLKEAKVSNNVAPIEQTRAKTSNGKRKAEAAPVRKRAKLEASENENGTVVDSPAVVADCPAAGDSPAVVADCPAVAGDSLPEVVKAADEGSKAAAAAVVNTEMISAPPSERNVYTMVTEKLRTFNKHYLHFIQVEEKRYQDAKQLAKGKSKTKDMPENDKNKSKRPDLKAITEMIRNNDILYNDKIIGHFPGVDVGHQFFSRAEMVALGFHQHWLNGIDFIGSTAGKSRKETSHYELPITTSIVLSGQYEDDLDNYDQIVYTGQGGNNLLGDKRQISDQVLRRGNLGLKNCMDQSVPVRVVRGHKCRNSYVGKVYTYDGLYKVVSNWAEKGVSGFTVYKFRLQRLEGQPPLTTDQVHFTRGCIPKSLSEIRGLVCEDITGGLEGIPIPVTNLVDDPPVAPADFVYINEIKFSKNISIPSVAPVGCDCNGACVDPKRCACAKFNGGDFPYVHHNGGRLVEPKGLVFECGPSCKCGPSCTNRTSQKGIKYRLEVYRTPNKGWGVRSWDYIPSGAPVCEYIGLLRKTADLDPAADNTYVFDIDCLQTMRGLDGRESRLRDVCLPSHVVKAIDEENENVPFCLDAGNTGNVARFINHSCQPNLFVQCMLSSHHDIKLARVILVAADNIPPLKELTYDYGYAVDSVVGPDGNIRKMECCCGAQECRKRLY